MFPNTKRIIHFHVEKSLADHKRCNTESENIKVLSIQREGRVFSTHAEKHRILVVGFIYNFLENSFLQIDFIFILYPIFLIYTFGFNTPALG